MNWSQPRKTFKSSDNKMNQRVSTTCLNTPPKHTQPGDQLQNARSQKQCPYHFGNPTHICLTCRRSICLRCAITYCQQHTIHPQQQILELLVTDLDKLTIQPRIQDLQLRLKQSKQRQQYLTRKIQKMLLQIEQNFDHTKAMLQKKKQQIIQYYKEQLEFRFIQEYRKFDEELYEKLKWLRDLQNNDRYPKCKSIQQLDQLAQLIKKEVPTGQAISKAEIKISKLIAGKDKIKTHTIWSQQKLENVLFEIQNISFKLRQTNLNTSFNGNKKKRVTTQTSQHNKLDKYDKPDKVMQFNATTKNPFSGIMIKSGSNSRFQSGRKIDH